MSTASEAPKPFPETLTVWVGGPVLTERRIDGAVATAALAESVGLASACGAPVTASPPIIATSAAARQAASLTRRAR